MAGPNLFPVHDTDIGLKRGDIVSVRQLGYYGGMNWPAYLVGFRTGGKTSYAVGVSRGPGRGGFPTRFIGSKSEARAHAFDQMGVTMAKKTKEKKKTFVVY
jgi:hypothetical protein